MKVTIQHYEMTYSAECSDDVNIDQLFGRVIIPLIIAAGWPSKNIGELFKGGLPTEWESAYEQ